MFPRFLLLLAILGLSNSLQLRDPWVWDSWGHETKEASGPVHLRERRQVVGDDDFEYPDYVYSTDPPELLKIVTDMVAAHPELPTTMAMLEQRVSMRTGTSETATVKVATTRPAGPDAGGLAAGMLSTESATQWSLTTAEMTIRPASTEPETSQPASREAETSHPAPTKAETSQPATTEAKTTQLPRNQAVESLFTTSAATEAPSTDPTAVETVSTESNKSTIFLGPSATLKDISHLSDSGLKKGLIVTPGSSLAPTPPGPLDLIPVKQCLLVILVLASLATIFLVCTVVLAVRLSRKTHMYPVRNYSPTEMICISSLLPEGGDGAPVTANGGLPKAQDLKTEPSGDRDGDDLTLHSFLP